MEEAVSIKTTASICYFRSHVEVVRHTIGFLRGFDGHIGKTRGKECKQQCRDRYPDIGDSFYYLGNCTDRRYGGRCQRLD